MKVLAFLLYKTYPQFFPNNNYDMDNPEHQEIIYECTTLQWRLNINRVIRDGIRYYCAVYEGVIKEVFELNEVNTLINMGNALANGQIIALPNGSHGIVGFNHRVLTPGEFDPTRTWLQGHIAPDEVRLELIGMDLGIHGLPPVRYSVINI